MGVTGLWRLIEPAGKPVPVETLENKILAVDISIWLHQMVKGYQDAKGAPLPNAHLMGLFQRLCKLLYFRIKPVFVFDGGFPDLKKETIHKRQENKSKYNSQSEKLKREIALLLGKKTAINALLGKQISPKKSKPIEDTDDIFKLPALPEKNVESESESDDESNSSASTVDLHSMDLDSDNFKNMPLKDKYDLLVELKETRKMNSWGKIHTLPKKSDNFSDFQMQRLLKRRKLQERLEETEKEMGDGGMSLKDLESLLNEEGIDTKIDSLPGKRIASDKSTRYLLISNVKQALADAKKKENITTEHSTKESGQSSNQNSSKRNELEDDLEKAIQMSLECVDDVETSGCQSKTDDSWTSNLTDTDYSDDEDCDGFEEPDVSSAKAYIMQYSDLTNKAIDDLVTSKRKGIKGKSDTVDKLINELNQEKSIIEDNIELTSSEEDYVEEKCVTQLNTEDSEKTVNISENENKNLPMHITNMNETELSVVYMENSIEEVICLDSSTDKEEPRLQVKQITSNLDEDSESNEDDFEEVSDNEDKLSKPSIQLTLNMGKKVEDDIFADIFNTSVSNSQEGPHLPNVSETMSHLSNENIPEQYNSTSLQTCVQKEEETRETNVEPTTSQNIIKVTETAKLQVSDDKLNSINKKPLDCKANKEYLTTHVEPSTSNNTSKVTETTDLEVSDDKLRLNVNKSFDSITASKEFSITLNEKTNKENITVENLNTIASEIENEERNLLQERGRLDRIGRNITEQMTKEAQQLLQVFGIPYIVAPMEAEAQCAFLESIHLTDGTITDDSDIWLFGGKTVYKNFFNHKKHVLQFLSERIEKSFNLTREQLVLLSLLVGSDYTTGVAGVGPVTALEILASFPFNKKKTSSCDSRQARYNELVAGLQDFKKWVKAGKRTDNLSLKKKLKNVNLSEDFPSVRVIQAYLEPNIEKSDEKFTWGKLDVTILREYTKTKFGWSQNKLDEIIKPVLARMLNPKNQKSVCDYFKRKLEFQSLEDQMSKRVKAAVQKMDPENITMEINDKSDKQKPKRNRNKKNDSQKAVPSKAIKVNSETRNIHQVVKSSNLDESAKGFEINIPKSGRYQEIIPQREKDKKSLLENKLKAIEVFRKTTIDRKKKPVKRKLPVPKEKAALSESDSD